MLTKTKEIEELAAQGFGLNVAIAYYWSFLGEEEKKNLKFRQLLWLWENAPITNPIRNEFWELLTETAKTVGTFDEKLVLWEKTSMADEELKAWKLLKSVANDFERRKILIKKTTDTLRANEAWEMIKEIAKTPGELVWILEKSSAEEKKEGWENIAQAIQYYFGDPA